jgi:hypothetical protein
MQKSNHLHSKAQHDRVPKPVFKAVCFARVMIRDGLPVGIAVYRASRFYNVSKTEVARALGQHAARVRENGRQG